MLLVHVVRPTRSPPTLVEQAGKTTLHIVMAFESNELRDMVVSTGMAEGAGESYDALEKLLAS